MSRIERWLIDDEGDWWAGGDSRLQGHLQSSMDLTSLWSFAIRNLGFIGIDRSSAWLRVRLRPAKVSPIAVVALYYAVSDRPPETTMLSQWEGTWQDEIVGGPKRLIERLNRLSVLATEPAGTWLSRHPVEPQSLAPDSAITAVYRAWVNRELGVEGELAGRCDDLFNGTFTIVRRHHDHSHIIVRQGFGYRIYNRSYLRSAVGTRIEDDPNIEYGRWVAEGLREALRKRQPLIEDVEASLAGPEGRRRVSYRRILVPFGLDDGLGRVLTASQLHAISPLYGKVA